MEGGTSTKRADGQKRKYTPLDPVETIDSDKRRKMEEETKTLSILMETHLGSAEVVKQPR